jgi:hypothetical protein
MLRALVQEHSLRNLYLGVNKFTVDTIPEVVGTMTKLEALDLRGLGYTGKSGTSPVMSSVHIASIFVIFPLQGLSLRVCPSCSPYITWTYLPTNWKVRGTLPVMSLVYVASNFLRHFSFIGLIPESIGQLQSLQRLQLHNNKLSGSFINISSGVWDVTSVVPCDFASFF